MKYKQPSRIRVAIARIMAAAIAAGPGAAWADTRIEYRIQGKDPVVESVLIGQGKLRVNQQGGRHWMLFDQASGTIYSFDGQARTYDQISATRLRALADLFDRANRAIDEQWARTLTQMRAKDRDPVRAKPGQLARSRLPQAVETLRSYGATQAELPTERELQSVYATFDKIDEQGWEGWFREMSKTQYQWMLDNTGTYQVRDAGQREVEGRSCRLTEVSLAIQAMPKPMRIIDYCTADPGSLGLPAAEKRVHDDFAATTAAVTQVMREFTVVPAGVARELGMRSKVPLGVDRITIDGVPLRTQTYDARQKPGSTATLSAVRAGERIDPGLLRIPAGYRRVETDTQLRKALASVAAMLAATAAAQDEAGP